MTEQFTFPAVVCHPRQPVDARALHESEGSVQAVTVAVIRTSGLMPVSTRNVYDVSGLHRPGPDNLLAWFRIGLGVAIHGHGAGTAANLPRLRASELDDYHVVIIPVQGEPWSFIGRQVDVDLHDLTGPPLQ